MECSPSEASINATNVAPGVDHVGSCRLTSVYLQDARVVTLSRSGIPVLRATQGPPEAVAKSNTQKPKRKRAKDYAKEAVQASTALQPASDWVQGWDSHYKQPYYFNTSTQESTWEEAAGGFIPDLSRPKKPSEVMDCALARAKEKKAFRAARRDAENFIGLLLRAVDLPEPEVVIGKLNKTVENLQLSIQERMTEGEARPDEGKANNLEECQAMQSREWDTLDARSSGLMKTIPEPSGSHIRFTDESTTLVGCPDPPAQSSVPPDLTPSKTARECGAASPTEPIPQYLEAIVSDVVDHTVDEQLLSEPIDGKLTQTLGKEQASLALGAAAHVANSSETSPEQDSLLSEAEAFQEQLQSNLSAVLSKDTTGTKAAAPAKLEASSEVLNTYDMLKEAHIHKYWTRRYSLWTKFDEGIKMDLEGWFSATPEAIARHQAERLACDIALDAFGGVGGNAVQLAKTCKQVLVCDISMERLLLARHNAEVYGVAHKMDFICGDFLKMAPKFQADAIFLSPPWGGPMYHPSRGFSYNVDKDIGGLGIGYTELVKIVSSALHAQSSLQAVDQSCQESSTASGQQECSPPETLESDAEGDVGHANSGADRNQENPEEAAVKLKERSRIACFLPKTTDLLQISEAVSGRQVEVESTYLDNFLKSITVYHSSV